MGEIVIPCNNGEVSDGYHAFDELYEHRHLLFIALMFLRPDLSWIAVRHHDGTLHDGWFIAGMRLPTGDISYHLPMTLWDLCAGIPTYHKAPEWDGHTSSDVLYRMELWIQTLLSND